jgi:hypothetical protein
MIGHAQCNRVETGSSDIGKAVPGAQRQHEAQRAGPEARCQFVCQRWKLGQRFGHRHIGDMDN